MSSDSLENEDLDNVPLVRMEDVQPSRDWVIESRVSPKDEDEVYEICVIDDIEYGNECIVKDDEDSNIGSMVSLQSEDVYDEDDSNQELIIPEVLGGMEDDEEETYVVKKQHNYVVSDVEESNGDELEILENKELKPSEKVYVEVLKENVDVKMNAVDIEPKEYKVNAKEFIIHAPVRPSTETITGIDVIPQKKTKKEDEIVISRSSESWPTLEVLPGGVIQPSNKYETDSFLYPEKTQETETNTGQMMYACAKCSQAFKYLFCLVKHVKWHEDQMKTPKDAKIEKQTNKASTNQYICLHSGKKKLVVSGRSKRKSPKWLKP